MNDVLGMFRETLELEAKMNGTPDSCTISRAVELAADAYKLGKAELEEQHLRERYAGLAMQAMLNGMMENLTLLEQMSRRAAREGYELISDMIADDAVAYADSLIERIKKVKE